MSSTLTAIGTANPIYSRPQLETAELISGGLHLSPAQNRLLKTIYKATGIEKRHSVLKDYCKKVGEFEFFPNTPGVAFPSTAKRMQVYKDHALTLALSAIQECFSFFKNFNLNEITHLITISCTGMYAPGLDIELVQALHLNSTTQRTAINFMGCYGVFNGMKVAHAICKSNPNAKVLLVSVELCTLHFQNATEHSHMISNAIFADGAAAALIETNPSRSRYLSLESFYCDLLPQTQQEMAWHIADSGFDIVLSSYVPQMIESGIADFFQKLLNHAKFTQAIDHYAIHPGGIKILEACEKALNIPKSANQYAYEVLNQYGNMSSATILFVLKKFLQNLNETHDNQSIFSCAFGPGLTLESMLLKIACKH